MVACCRSTTLTMWAAEITSNRHSTCFAPSRRGRVPVEGEGGTSRPMCPAAQLTRCRTFRRPRAARLYIWKLRTGVLDDRSPVDRLGGKRLNNREAAAQGFLVDPVVGDRRFLSPKKRHFDRVDTARIREEVPSRD